jgi:XapX domain-containing protein
LESSTLKAMSPEAAPYVIVESVMVKDVFSVLLAFLIGAGCRWFEIPVPAPPRLFGALLIIAITGGYMLTDAGLSRSHRESPPVTASSQERPR